MYKIQIIAVGKTKEKWLEEAVGHYLLRLKNSLQIEFVFAKDDEELLLLIKNCKEVICLDEKGQRMSSLEFSKYLFDKLEKGRSRLAIIIGGASGLPKELKDYQKISLSPMTLTHQMVRLLLVEQIYRAFEIAKNSPYHK